MAKKTDNFKLPKSYEAKDYEDKIYQLWEKSGFFNPDNLKTKGKPFVISMPPPNLTGILHLGHVLEDALMDTEIRYQRLRGRKTLLLPGTDHAAVATQARVEKDLIESGKYKNPRQELGRKRLLKIIQEYTDQSQSTIIKQIKKLGTSCDWSRLAYTFDEARSKAVSTAFKKMYDDGLIYRGYRVVNWCVGCQSTLADDEVEYIEAKTPFYYFKYGPVTIGTARPETKFADKVIIVHPKDKRYQKIIGKEFEVEWIDGKVKAMVIADELADMKMGSGAMTITPAHSFVDFDLARKYNLSIEQIINKEGKLTKAAGKLAGLPVKEARTKVVEILQKKGLVKKIDKDYVHNLSVCYRCGTPIEPLTSEQWFIDVNKKITSRNKSLKEITSAPVKQREIKILPKRFEKVYYHWLDNLRDWCISRQIWWGHQIPVWYKENSKSTNIKITFFRHAQSEANALKVGAGHKDYKLTTKGIKQAQDIAKEINQDDFDVVFSSDLSRAKQTAKILFTNSKKKIILDKRLREIDFGDLTGKSGLLINEHRVKGFPNGETYQDVRDRFQLFINDLYKKYNNKNIAIVAHSGIWKILEIIFNNKDFTKEFLNIHAPLGAQEYDLSRGKKDVYIGLKPPKGNNWTQDPDTLDTWFSSALWTFSTLGWPDKTKDLKNFHPTSWIQMGHEILFFWMARMIMMSTYLLDEVPFKDVYFHGIVRDKQGKKYSKSLRNAVDPQKMIDKYGTDALRLSVIIGSSPGVDMRLYDEKIAGSRNFVNKLWNISRFILGQMKTVKRISKEPPARTLADKWILSEFNLLIQQVTGDLDKFNFSSAGEKLHEFTWSKLADWYLEVAKIEGRKDQILLYILERSLILWHPFTPFVTEVIYQQFSAKDLLMVQNWPKAVKVDLKVVKDFSELQNIVIKIRNIRSKNKIPPKDFIDCYLTSKILSKNEFKVVAKLARINLVNKQIKGQAAPAMTGTGGQVFSTGKSKGYLRTVKSMTDKEIENLENYISSLEVKLKNQRFVTKAPVQVIKEVKEKLKLARKKLSDHE